jgi:hypothetical protein
VNRQVAPRPGNRRSGFGTTVIHPARALPQKICFAKRVLI